MRKSYRTMTLFKLPWMLTALVTAVFFGGCAEKGPILLSGGYQPAEGKAVVAKGTVVGVSPFKDVRGTSPSLLGTRTLPDGDQDDFVVQGTVADLVTASMKDALKAHGLTVKDVPAWDLTTEGMKDEGAPLVISGEIKTLRIDTKVSGLKTNLSAVVQIKVVVGDVQDKKILRTIDVQSRIEQELLYSREKLESALSEALTSALEQIFRDDVLSKRLQLP